MEKTFLQEIADKGHAEKVFGRWARAASSRTAGKSLAE